METPTIAVLECDVEPTKPEQHSATPEVRPHCRFTQDAYTRFWLLEKGKVRQKARETIAPGRAYEAFHRYEAGLPRIPR